jgi:hypothetical protein
MEPKGNGNPSPMKSQLKEENVPQIESNIVVGRRMYENEIVPHSQPSTKNQNKVQRSFLSSIFGRCMSPPTIKN